MPFYPTQPGSAGGVRGRRPEFLRGLVLLALALILIAGALFYNPQTQDLEPGTVLRIVESGEVSVTTEHPLVLTVDARTGVQHLSGWYRNPNAQGQETHFRTAIPPNQTGPGLLDAIRKAGLEVTESRPGAMDSIVYKYMPFVVVILVGLRLYWRISRRNAARGA